VKLLFDKQLKGIIKRCQNGDRSAQSKLYKHFADKMYGICLRYVKNEEDAQDVLQEGFMRVYRGIPNYKGQGSFEGWMRTTFVRTALRHLEKNQRLQYHQDIEDVDVATPTPNAVQMLSHGELLKLVEALPTGYRIVFNLYVIEGYTHHEIAEMLGITEGTSKSQLSRARNQLKEQIIQLTSVPSSEILKRIG